MSQSVRQLVKKCGWICYNVLDWSDKGFESWEDFGCFEKSIVLLFCLVLSSVHLFPVSAKFFPWKLFRVYNFYSIYAFLECFKCFRVFSFFLLLQLLRRLTIVLFGLLLFGHFLLQFCLVGAWAAQTSLLIVISDQASSFTTKLHCVFVSSESFKGPVAYSRSALDICIG